MTNNLVGTNAQEYTVSEISNTLKRTVEDQFGYIRVRAELSGVKRAASGHIYFALKDDNAVMDGVCWRGSASKLSFVPEDGLEVICSGKLTTYPARSKYQMVVDHMEPAGAGALMALLEERKKKLSAEGLFDASRKKRLPYIPKVIGVVTSPTGAVIRDILHRLNDRFPRQVLVWPVLVQGEGAAEQISKAIDGFNKLDGSGKVPKPDLLIVARGGGSIEDLWCFNEEVVVRSVAASEIPLISAVGHETDTTLIDYASDLRAPTPTGAAEMAVPVKEELKYTIADYSRRLDSLKSNIVSERSERVKGLARGLPSPRDILGLVSQKFDELSERLPRGLVNVTQKKDIQFSQLKGGLRLSSLEQLTTFKAAQLQNLSSRLEPVYERQLFDANSRVQTAGRMLESLSFKRVLDRGYTMVERADGKPVSKAEELSVNERVVVRFKDGSHDMIVGANPDKPVEKQVAKKVKKKPPEDDGRQGNLL